MYTVSVGAMKMRGWTMFFRVIRMTYAALRAARQAEGCVHADIFREGRRYFAYSIWTDTQAMKSYAMSGTHGDLMRNQSTLLVDFVNHTYRSDKIPTRSEVSAIWHAAQS